MPAPGFAHAGNNLDSPLSSMPASSWCTCTPWLGFKRGSLVPLFLGSCVPTLPVSLHVQASYGYCSYALCLFRGPPRAVGRSQATPSIATSCSSWCPTRSFSTRSGGGKAALQQLGWGEGFLWSPPRLTQCCEETGRRVVVMPACAWHPCGAPIPPTVLQTHPTPVPVPLPAQPSWLQDMSPSFCILAGRQHRLGRGAEQARQHRAVPACHAEGSLRLPPGHGVSTPHPGSHDTASWRGAPAPMPSLGPSDHSRSLP